MKAVLIFFCLLVSTNIQAQGWEWMNGSVGGRHTRYIHAATDKNKNIYNTGQSFGGQFGSHTVPVSSWWARGLIVKYDSAGNAMWIKATETENWTHFFGITIDEWNNIYILGVYDSLIKMGTHSQYEENTTFPTGSTYQDWQPFIMKLDSMGNTTWIKNMGKILIGGNYWYGSKITTDNCGNVYVTIPYEDTAIVGSYTLVNHDTSVSGSSDILVAKFDSSANVIWAKSFGGNSGEHPISIKVGSSGAVYIAGCFKSDTLSFGTTHLVDTISTMLIRSWTSFVAKLDHNGNPVWAKSNGGRGDCNAQGFAIDSSENTYITGGYSNHEIAFDSHVLLTAPPLVFGSTYQYYGFLAKYDSMGNVAMVKQLKQTIGAAATVDPCQNIWIVTGRRSTYSITNDTIDGHEISYPMQHHNPLTLTGWTNTGTYISSNIIPTGYWDGVCDVESDRCGDIYVNATTTLDTFSFAGNVLINHIPGPAFPRAWYTAKYSPNLHCPCKERGVCNVDDILVISEGVDSICVGDSIGLSNATTGGVWSSNNNTIATIGTTSGIVTGVSPGNVIITYALGGSFVTTVIKVGNYSHCITETSTINYNNEKVDDLIKIYPNPASNELNINYSGSQHKIIKVEIVDVTGKQLLSNVLTHNTNTVSLRELQTGIYICKIIVDGKDKIIKKITILK